MPEPSEGVNLNDLESALRELRPHPETLDRAALMYRAGRASARGWGWPVATMVSGLAALTLAIVLCIRPAPATVYVAVPPPRSDAVLSSPSPLSTEDAEFGAWLRYVQLQEQVSLNGLDGLAPSSEAEEIPSNLDSLLRSMQ